MIIQLRVLRISVLSQQAKEEIWLPAEIKKDKFSRTHMKQQKGKYNL